MFTKENVLKAICKINSYKANRDCILEEYEGDNSESYLKSVNEAMCSDELVSYLNENCANGLNAVEFGELQNLGYLGKCLSAAYSFCDEHGISHNYEEITNEKVCLVGSNGWEGGVYSGYSRGNSEETYITESGKVLIVRTTEYGVFFEGNDENETLLTVHLLNDTEAVPLMNEIDCYFPEEYQGFYDC